MSSRTTIFSLEIPRPGEVFVVTLEFPDIVMREMLSTHHIDIIEGEISYTDNLLHDELSQEFPVFFSPVFCQLWEVWVTLGKVQSVGCGMIWHGVVAVCGGLYQ
jgi:hypothetical protein